MAVHSSALNAPPKHGQTLTTRRLGASWSMAVGQESSML